MHPIVFEDWWRIESARVQQRAEMAAVVREARLDRSSRGGRLPKSVRPGWRRSGRVPAGALAFGQWLAGRLPMPVTTAAVDGKRG